MTTSLVLSANCIHNIYILVGEMLKFDWLLAWVLNHLDPKFAS